MSMLDGDETLEASPSDGDPLEASSSVGLHEDAKAPNLRLQEQPSVHGDAKAPNLTLQEQPSVYEDAKAPSLTLQEQSSVYEDAREKPALLEAAEGGLTAKIQVHALSIGCLSARFCASCRTF